MKNKIEIFHKKWHQTKAKLFRLLCLQIELIYFIHLSHPIYRINLIYTEHCPSPSRNVPFLHSLTPKIVRCAFAMFIIIYRCIVNQHSAVQNYKLHFQSRIHTSRHCAGGIDCTWIYTLHCQANDANEFFISTKHLTVNCIEFAIFLGIYGRRCTIYLHFSHLFGIYILWNIFLFRCTHYAYFQFCTLV